MLQCIESKIFCANHVKSMETLYEYAVAVGFSRM